MTERRMTLPGIYVSYTGVFDLREFFRMMNDWFVGKGYDILEKRHEELVRETGKQIIYISEPYLKINDYVQLNINVNIVMQDVQDVELTHEGVLRKLKSGSLTIRLRGFVDTDYEGRWTSMPWRWYLRVLTERYIIRREVSQAEDQLETNIKELHRLMKKYFNLMEAYEQ